MSNCSTNPIDYACVSGILSVPAAGLLALVYSPLFFWCASKVLKRPNQVFAVLAFFCAVRITSFVTRAFLALSPQNRHNLNLFIANDIIFDAGFFGLLYSAYILVLERESLSEDRVSDNIVTHITRNRHLLRFALASAVALSIAGACEVFLGDKSSSKHIGHILRKISTIMFLSLTGFLAFQTLLFLGFYKGRSGTFWSCSGACALILIVLLLLIRGAYLTAILGKVSVPERLWYPLAALPELLAVCLFGTRGLVPGMQEPPPPVNSPSTV